MIVEFWLLITAIIFTFVGMSFRRRPDSVYNKIIESTVNKLIEDEFIKTRIDENGEVELLKYYEEA